MSTTDTTLHLSQIEGAARGLTAYEAYRAIYYPRQAVRGDVHGVDPTMLQDLITDLHHLAAASVAGGRNDDADELDDMEGLLRRARHGAEDDLTEPVGPYVGGETLFHGTRTALEPGAVLQPSEHLTLVYATTDLEQAKSWATLKPGEDVRVYEVEMTDPLSWSGSIVAEHAVVVREVTL